MYVLHLYTVTYDKIYLDLQAKAQELDDINHGNGIHILWWNFRGFYVQKFII